MKAYFLFYKNRSIMLFDRSGPVDYAEIPNTELEGNWRSVLEKELGASFVAKEVKRGEDIILLVQSIDSWRISPELYFYPLDSLDEVVLLRGHRNIIEDYVD